MWAICNICKFAIVQFNSRLFVIRYNRCKAIDAQNFQTRLLLQYEQKHNRYNQQERCPDCKIKVSVNYYSCITGIKGDRVHSIAAHKTRLLCFKFSYIQLHVSLIFLHFPWGLKWKNEVTHSHFYYCHQSFWVTRWLGYYKLRFLLWNRNEYTHMQYL